MRIALVQMPRVGLGEGVRWLLERLPRADVVVLPEYWLGRSVLDGEGLRRLVGAFVDVASAVGGVVVAGGVAVAVGSSVRGVCPVVGREGLLTWGEKIFPSAATGERGWLSPGSRLALFAVSGWAVGCLICIDLIYPELVRRLALAGAELVVNPASISADRRGLWGAVGLVRAFENSIYVASAVGTGFEYADGRPVAGGSYVASPNGGFRSFGSEAGVYVAELDRGEVLQARARRRYLDDVKAMGGVDLNIYGL